ncbi:P2Y purinoceptor 2 [Biomphalaria glabrata]|nr:P2Y purinoceptor 2-like [Biomphalaria glabrata]
MSEENIYISEEAMNFFHLGFSVVANLCLTTMSIVLNIVNVSVFVTQGLKERVNFNLFCLSLVDLLGAVSLTTVVQGFIAHHWNPEMMVEWYLYIYVVNWTRNLFYDLSTALTVFITIERCTCITLPFYFKSSFMARHTKQIILGVVLFVVINYVPIFSTFGLESSSYTENNSTVTVLLYSKLCVELQRYNDIAFGVVVAAACQLCIFICAVLMHRGLRQSVKLKNSRHIHVEVKTGINGLSKREKDVVRMILVLASMYLVSTMPQIVYCWARVIVPGMDSYELKNVNIILSYVVVFMSSTYGALSFFVYFCFNTKYRFTLRQVCCTVS